MLLHTNNKIVISTNNMIKNFVLDIVSVTVIAPIIGHLKLGHIIKYPYYVCVITIASYFQIINNVSSHVIGIGIRGG